jgi:hypothetical protein
VRLSQATKMVQHQQHRSHRRANHHRRQSINDTPTGDSRRYQPLPNNVGHPSGLALLSIATFPTVDTRVVSPSLMVHQGSDPTADRTQLQLQFPWPHLRLSVVA